MKLKNIKMDAAAIALTLGTFAVAPQLAVAETLRVGINAPDISTLDPTRATATADVTLVSWMFNGLVRFPPGSADPAKIEPDLAESWTSSPDGLVWTFKLRPNVKFHGDYGTLRSEDVVFSLMRAKDPKTSSFSSDFSGVKSIDAVDPMTVRITLSEPVPGFHGLIANYHGGNIIRRRPLAPA